MNNAYLNNLNESLDNNEIMDKDVIPRLLEIREQAFLSLNLTFIVEKCQKNLANIGILRI
jgi:hypothetical protein